jgi:intracellular multiplication protein IcmO
MANPKTHYEGVERHQEIRHASRIEDVRSIPRKLADLTDSADGTFKVFALLTGASLLFCWLPGVPEMILLFCAIPLYLGYYRRGFYRRRLWDLPFRVPAWIGAGGREFLDRTTGKAGDGEIYIGREFNSGREVWASGKDMTTHGGMIGTTGSGKSEALFGFVHNALMLGSGAILIDGKAHHKTRDSLFRIARAMGRDEDFLVMNFIKGGRDRDVVDDIKTSHTFNPVAVGSSDMKSELLAGLLADTGSGDGSWQERAISFVQGVTLSLALLTKEGLVISNPELFARFVNLARLENLVHFGVFVDIRGNLVDLRNETINGRIVRDSGFAALYAKMKAHYFGLIEFSLNSLPAYTETRPRVPHMLPEIDPVVWIEFKRSWRGPGPGPNGEAEITYPRAASGRDGDPPADGPVTKREEALNQHGYLESQLVPAIATLTFGYREIYNDEIGEVDFRDVILNRRLLVVLLPSLERNEKGSEMLGRLAVAAIKGALAQFLDTPMEGSRRQIIEAAAENARTPFFIILDEYGYYLVRGFAKAFAQARGFLVSLLFGVQTYDDLLASDKVEGERTWGNANIKYAGRTTSGYDSETYRKLAGAGGRAQVQVIQDAEYNPGDIGAPELSRTSRMEERERISVDDLNKQKDGEFTMIVGAGDATGRGGARVVRYLSYFTGDMPETKELRLPHFVAVRPPMAGFAGGDSGADAARARIQRERRLEASNDAEIRRQLDIIAGSDAPIGGVPGAGRDAAPEGEPLQTFLTLPQVDVETFDGDMPLDDRPRRMAMTPEREAIAIAMLAEGKSQAEIARAIDVSRATLSRWAARKAEERPLEAVDPFTGEIVSISAAEDGDASPFD